MKNKKIIVLFATISIILFILIAMFIFIKTLNTKEISSKIDKEVINEIEIIDVQPTNKDNSNELIVELENKDKGKNKTESKKENANKKKPKSTANSNKVTGESKYYIKVNYKENVVTIYTKDKEGNYTVPYKAMLCSVGKGNYGWQSEYTTSSKYRWLQLYYGVSGQYATRIYKAILFHSVPYETYGDSGSLEYWEYDKLGTTCSAGCIRLTVADAKWIYDNCPSGTKVKFYSSSNPGPLGKPSAQKISSSDESLRGWDPTDYDSNNPWIEYRKNQEITNNNTSTDKKEEDVTIENTINNITPPVETENTTNTVAPDTLDNNTLIEENEDNTTSVQNVQDENKTIIN